MKYVLLQNDKDERFFIRLDNWGDGIDELHRRWVLQLDRALHVDCWICLETSEIASPVRKRLSDLFKSRPSLDEILAKASEAHDSK